MAPFDCGCLGNNLFLQGLGTEKGLVVELKPRHVAVEGFAPVKKTTLRQKEHPFDNI